MALSSSGSVSAPASALGNTQTLLRRISGRDIGIYKNRRPPHSAPPQADATTSELRGFEGVPKTGEITDEMARQFRAAYLACVTFVDAQIGRVLKELERLK